MQLFASARLELPCGCFADSKSLIAFCICSRLGNEAPFTRDWNSLLSQKAERLLLGKRRELLYAPTKSLTLKSRYELFPKKGTSSGKKFSVKRADSSAVRFFTWPFFFFFYFVNFLEVAKHGSWSAADAGEVSKRGKRQQYRPICSL